MTLDIYITDLGAYNEGRLKGEWVSLPIDEDELKEIVSRYGEETFITDYSCDLDLFDVYEYDDPFKLNELAAKVADAVDEHGQDTVEAVFAALEGESIETVLDILDQGRYSILWDVDDEEDLGYALVYEGYFAEVPKELLPYLDYEAIGRDAVLDDGWQITSHDCAVRIDW